MRFFDNLPAPEKEEKAREALDRGLRAHHFLRMTAKDSREQWKGNLDNFECSCGAEFADEEQMREHQALYLGII